MLAAQRIHASSEHPSPPVLRPPTSPRSLNGTAKCRGRTVCASRAYNSALRGLQLSRRGLAPALSRVGACTRRAAVLRDPRSTLARAQLCSGLCSCHAPPRIKREVCGSACAVSQDRLNRIKLPALRPTNLLLIPPFFFFDFCGVPTLFCFCAHPTLFETQALSPGACSRLPSPSRSRSRGRAHGAVAGRAARRRLPAGACGAPPAAPRPQALGCAADLPWGAPRRCFCLVGVALCARRRTSRAKTERPKKETCCADSHQGVTSHIKLRPYLCLARLHKPQNARTGAQTLAHWP